MSRPLRTLLALSASLGLSAPAWANGPDTPVSVWGNTGAILTPTAHVLGFQDMQLGGGVFFGGGSTGSVVPYGSFHMGLFQGWEGGITVNTPGGPGQVAADLKIRLLKQNGPIPFSLAVGGMQLGSSANTAFSMSNQLYMVIGHDLQLPYGDPKAWTLARASLGFMGNLQGAQPMANLQIPILHYGSLEAEYVGPRGSIDHMINVGLTANPFTWLGVRVANMGTLNTAFADRTWVVGANLTWKTPTNGNLFDIGSAAGAAPTPAPSKAAAIPSPPAVVSPPPVTSPKPSQAPAASPTPAPVVEGVVKGKVTHAGKGVDRIPLELIGNVSRKAWSEADGSFTFPKAPTGTYKLKVQRDGWKPVEQEVVLGPGATEVKVELTALPATLKGQVTSGNKGVGGVTVAIDALGVITLTKADGTYQLTDIPAGSYQITYSRNNKQVDKVTLTLGQGETVARNVTLNGADAPQSPAKALIRGTITDAKNMRLTGVRVTLEGKDLTVMTISGPDGGFVLRELPAGTYKLSVSKQGFTARYFSLTLKSGQEVKHTIAITAEPKR